MSEQKNSSQAKKSVKKAEEEAILVQPSLKGYWEYLLVGLVLMLYGGWGLLILLGVWYHKSARRYTLTRQTITFEKGTWFWRRVVRVVRISSISKIVVNQDTVGKQLGTGTVRVFFSNDDPLHIRAVPHPVELKALLLKYQEESKVA